MTHKIDIIKKIIASVFIPLILFLMLIFPNNVSAFSASDVEGMSDDKFDTASEIGTFLVKEMGLTEAVALGVLGNIGAECGFDIAAKEAGPPQEGRGICQWSYGRREKLIARVPDWETNLHGQLEYLKWELESDYKNSVLEPLLELGNTEEDMYHAAWIWVSYFEVPGSSDQVANGYPGETWSWPTKAPMRYYETCVLRGDIGKALLDSGKLNFSLSGKTSGDVIIKKATISPISNVSITNGSSLFTTDKEKEKRQEINLEIYNSIIEGVSSSDSEQYSLYDRFGPKLQFVQYYGEETSELKLFDHIISSAFITHEDIEIKEDILNYESLIYLSNNVYAKRPTVLSSEMVSAGYEDPRVTLYHRGNVGEGTILVHANILLSISSFTVNLMNKLLNNDFQNYAYERILALAEDNVLTEMGETIFIAIGFILFIVFIFSLVKHVATFLAGKNTIGRIVTRIIMCFISLGFIFLVIYNPSDTIKWGHYIVNSTDTIFKEGLQEVSFKQDDEVVSSSSIDNVLEAYMWRTALFEPWCEGTFGTKYENLYTQFDTDSSHKKMPQSYVKDHESIPDSSTNVYYDSATLTGDVVVDVGKGKQIRNWGAFLYSALSEYHIDATMFIDAITVEEETLSYKALRTADGAYNADLFRVIDAKMNISPEYMKDDGKEITVDSYTNSNQFETHYYKAGWSMLWRALLMLMLLPVVVLKISAYFRVLFNFFKGIYYGMVEILKENQGLSDWWTKFKQAIIDYFYRSIQLYILIIMYINFIQKDNIIFTIMFIVLTLVVTAITPKDIYRAGLTTKRNLQRWF